MLGIASLVAGGACSGTTFYYVGASNVWNTAACYSLTKGGAGGDGIPGSEDTIKIDKGQTVFLDDSSITFLNGVKEVDFPSDGSTAYIHLERDFDLNCWFGDVERKGGTSVYLVKTGPGKLTFAKANTGEHATSQDTYGYYIGLDIREGSIQLEPSSGRSMRHAYKDVIVAEGATLLGVTNGVTAIWSLAGAGTVTNLYHGTTPELRTTRGFSAPTVFSGVLSGYPTFRPAGHTYYTGVASTIGGSGDNFKPFNWSGTGTAGITGFKTWAGENDKPSSLGRGDLLGGDGAFYLLYLGDTGETISRSVTLNNVSPKTGSVIDAGAHGGLVFTGKFGPRSTTKVQQMLVLSGSNTVACILSNAFSRVAANGTNFSMHVTKKGTGTWRFADNENRNLTGAIAVEDGTLEFESIRAAGLMCSLGFATDLYECKGADPDNLTRLPYAYLLGGDGTVGRFAYVGEGSCCITNRPIALGGDAVLAAPNAGALKWAGVSAEASGNCTLAFDCVAGQTNALANVSDGKGTVSIEKTGPGDLTLSGDLSFSGDLSAKGGGTLTVLNINNMRYAWYRLNLKETVYTSPHPDYAGYAVNNNNNSTGNGSRAVVLNEWGLYSHNGTKLTRLNQYGTGSLGTDSYALPPGMVACDNGAELSYFDAGTDVTHEGRLLDNSRSSGYMFKARWTDRFKTLSVDDPTTWISVVLHMGDYSRDITHYDLNYGAATNLSGFGQCPTAFSIEASGDGIIWEEIAATNNLTAEIQCFTNYYSWLSSGVTTYPDISKPEGIFHPGIPLASSRVQGTYDVLGNVRSVSAAPGTTLRLVSDTPVVVHGLTVDPAGFGAIEGFDFAADGCLYVAGDALPDGTFTIPGSFGGASGLSNISGWSLVCNGREYGSRRRVDVSESGITIHARGVVVSIR